MSTATITEEALSAAEFLTYIAPAEAAAMHDGWGTTPSADDIIRVHGSRLEALAIDWADWHGYGGSISDAVAVLADLIAAGPREWQRGVL